MRSPPRISAIVPCFNASSYIRATLESVLAQTLPVLEIIVVDDGSTDGSADLVEREFPQVCVIRQPNGGVAGARNHGIERAVGDWIAFVDADDFWLPGKLERQWKALTDDGSSSMSCTSWHVWSSTDAQPADELIDHLAAMPEASEGWVGPSGWIYPELLVDCQVWTSTVLVHKELIDRIGGFDESLRIGEDLDLWLRASRCTPIVRVQRPLALYRMHPTSLTKAPPRDAWQARVVERALARWGYASPDGRSARKTDVDRALAGVWRDYAGAHLGTAGDPVRARHGAWTALQLDWTHPGTWKILLKSAVCRRYSSGRVA